MAILAKMFFFKKLFSRLEFTDSVNAMLSDGLTKSHTSYTVTIICERSKVVAIDMWVVASPGVASPDTLTLDRTGLLAHLSLVLCDPTADSL
jgi:hypothetical protein